MFSIVTGIESSSVILDIILENMFSGRKDLMEILGNSY
jgi:hypothetical protein